MLNAMIRMSLLGAVDLRGPDDVEIRNVLAQPKRFALLAYLAAAMPRAFHSRDTLLALFWPELDQRHANASLRQSLYVLRRALGDRVVVTCGDEVIGLDRARIWCDVAAFDQAIDAGHHTEALALYGGRLLAGYHVSGAPEFDRWLEGQRARVASRFEAVVWLISEYEEQQGNRLGALALVRRLLLLDSENERALRRVISLLDQTGDRISALREYRSFARRIADDYELTPSPETARLISAICSPVRQPVEERASNTLGTCSLMR